MAAFALFAVLVGTALARAQAESLRLGNGRPNAVVADNRGYPRTYHIWGSEGAPGSLARYDMVVGYAYWDIAALRRRNPRAILLLNAGLQPRTSKDYRGLAVTYGGISSWRGGNDRLGGGPKLGKIRAFDPYWDLLYNADGSASTVNAEWGHGGLNLADPMRKGTPELVAKVIAHAGKLGGLYSKGWDGIHSDNWFYRIGVGWFYGSTIDSDRNGSVDDYTSLRRNWAAGLTQVGTLLRRYLPGKIVGGNGSWNVRTGSGTDFRPYLGSGEDNLRSTNYTLLENLEQYAQQPDTVIAAVREWLGYRDPLGRARYFAVMHRVADGHAYRSIRWGASLATIAGAYYEAYASSHDDRIWVDEYDGGRRIGRQNWLGQPTGAPRRLANGLWWRAFENGIVLNNSTATPQSVLVPPKTRRITGTQAPEVNDGSSAAEITIPAGDGLFLSRS